MKDETKKTLRLDNDELRGLCVKHDWFTSGSIKQYEKLFYMNEMGSSIEEIATVIWLCSNEKWCRRDILVELNTAIVMKEWRCL